MLLTPSARLRYASTSLLMVISLIAIITAHPSNHNDDGITTAASSSRHDFVLLMSSSASPSSVSGIVALRNGSETRIALWRLGSQVQVSQAAAAVCRHVLGPKAASAGRLLPPMPHSESAIDDDEVFRHHLSSSAQWYTEHGPVAVLPPTTFLRITPAEEEQALISHTHLGSLTNAAVARDLRELVIECRAARDQSGASSQLDPSSLHRTSLTQGTTNATVVPSNYFIITLGGILRRQWVQLLISRFINMSSTRVYINVENASAPEEYHWSSSTINFNFSILDDAQVPFNTTSASGDEWALDPSTSAAVRRLNELSGREVAYFLGASALFSHAPWHRPKPCLMEWVIESNSSLLQGKFGLVKAGPRGSTSIEKSTVCSGLVDPYNVYSVGEHWTSSSQPQRGENWTAMTKQLSKLVCGAGGASPLRRTMLVPSFLSELRDETTLKNVTCPSDATSIADCTYEDPQGTCSHFLDVGAMCGTNLVPEYPTVAVSLMINNLTWEGLNESFRRVEKIYSIPFERINVTSVSNMSETVNRTLYCDPQSPSYWRGACLDCFNATTAAENPFCYMYAVFTIAYDSSIDGPSIDYFNVSESGPLLSRNEYTIHDLNLLLSYVDVGVMSVAVGWNYATSASMNGTIDGVFVPAQEIYSAYATAHFQPLLPTATVATAPTPIQTRCPTRTRSLPAPTAPPTTGVPPTRSLAPGATAAPSTLKPTQAPLSVVPLSMPTQQVSSASNSGSSGGSGTALVATTGGIVATAIVAVIVAAVVLVCWFKRTSTSDGVVSTSGKQSLKTLVGQREGKGGAAGMTEMWNLEDPLLAFGSSSADDRAKGETSPSRNDLARRSRREKQKSTSSSDDDDESVIL